MLLTAEGLLFATLAVGVTLQTLGPGAYLPRFIKNGGLAFWIALTIAAIAVGAGSAWWTIYAQSFPQQLIGPLAESVGLAMAIVAHPILAFVVWWGVKGT